MFTPISMHEDIGRTMLEPSDVLLDDGANVSVFWNRDLLSDIREGGHFEVQGIGPGAVANNLIGDVEDFGTVRWTCKYGMFRRRGYKYNIVWDQA